MKEIQSNVQTGTECKQEPNLATTQHTARADSNSQPPGCEANTLPTAPSGHPNYELSNRNTTKNECPIFNIDHSSNKGTHWVCLFIKEGVPYYSDSYGFGAPSEVIDYFTDFTDFYYDNTFKIQKYGEVICDHFVFM